METAFVAVATNYHYNITELILIFDNISSTAEQKAFGYYLTCHTNSTEVIIYMAVSYSIPA